MSKAIEELKENGVCVLGEILDAEKIDNLYKTACSKRDFDKNIFLTEEEYLKQENHLGANPDKKFNFLNELENEVDFIHKDEKLQEIIKSTIGNDYEVVINKMVCGVPFDWLPEWVKKKIDGVNVANLGPYIKKEYRDITYFRGIDFHQDIIDWPKGSIKDVDPGNFITVYIYLHDVTENDAPLHVMPKSHKLGATLFPHELSKVGKTKWKYSEKSNSIDVDDIVLTGGAGYVAFWHNCTLHGTQPVENESDNFRLSLRLLLSKSKDEKNRVGIDEVNDFIQGDLSPEKTRKDLDEKGKAVLKGNIINEY